MLAPAGAPRAYIDKLNGALVQAMRSPLIVERLNAEGAAPEPTTPEGLRRLIQVDSQRWAKAVKLSGAKLE
jgi:tripartite-type tricarboxylate transporter receptor subunit TctC